MQGAGLGFCIETYCCPCKVESGNQVGQEVEDLPSPEEEEDEDSGMPGVPRAPQVRARRRHVFPQSKPTQHMVASDQDASADLKSKGSSDFRQLSDMLHSEESSEEEELYTDLLTSHTTASDSTIGNLSSPLGPISSRVEDSHAVSKTESQFSSNMPYLEDSTPSDISPGSNHTSTDDSVFVTESNNTSNNTSSPISSPAPPLPRRSTRGKPPERYGKVYTFDTLVDIGPNFKCPCDYCTYN